jgi:hypothetical protein
MYTAMHLRRCSFEIILKMFSLILMVLLTPPPTAACMDVPFVHDVKRRSLGQTSVKKKKKKRRRTCCCGAAA